VCLALGLVFGAEGIKERSEISAEYKWKLEDIYTNWSEWEQELNEFGGMIERFGELQGTLDQGPDQLLKVFKLRDDIGKLRDRVFVFAALSADLDNRDNDLNAKRQQASILMSQYGTVTSWINPEMLQIPWETMKGWLEATPELAPYRYSVENLYRQQAHVLNAEQEKLLSYFSRFAGTPNTVHNQLSTADIEYETIELSTGEEATVSEGGYANIIATNRNQDDRRAAMEARNGVYNATINTYAAAYDGICQRDWAYAQARNYSNCLEASLERDNVPVDVYLNLIAAVREGTGPLQRYHELRGMALGLDSYHFYDTSLPVVEIEEDYDYDAVREDVINSTKALGRSYQKKLKQAFSPGWVDVYETPGKSTGAYSWGVYGVHPYMLLNYANTMNDVFTLAHEMGHSVHTMFSWEEQPYATADYTLFVAEVASTMAEAFLLDYLLEKSSDPREKLVLLSHAMDAIAGTFYTQVMFADFEYQTHKLVEDGKPITAEVLNGIYRQLLVDYYGDAIAHDDLYDITWARIGHFYFYPYYVYQYATSYASSATLYRKMQTGNKAEKKEAVNAYIGLLQSGGNDYPMDQLKAAGVDLSQPAAVNAVIARMDELVGQFEAELKNLELID